jgi:phosphate:Na+ symporter
MFGHICEMILALGVLYSGIVSLNQYSFEASRARKKIKKREKPSLVLSFLKSAGITALIADSGKLVMYSTSSFCFSGLMNFETAFVCILGSNLTAGASSFLALINERNFIYIILGLGGFMRFFLRRSGQENLKLVAMFIFSIGLLLFGIILMKDNFAFIGNNYYLKHVVTTFHYSGLIMILIGTAISFIMQSTAGFSFMVIGLWGSNLISYEQSILMLYGSCISSCIKSRVYALPFKGSARRLMLVSANIVLASTIITIGLYFLERTTSIPLLNSLLRSIHRNVVFEVSGAMLISNLFIVLSALIFLKPLIRLYNKLYPDDTGEVLAKTQYINNIESLPKSQWPELMS